MGARIETIEHRRVIEEHACRQHWRRAAMAWLIGEHRKRRSNLTEIREPAGNSVLLRCRAGGDK